MAAGLTNHQAIRQVKTTSGNAPLTTGQYGEKASQTFIDGTPVQLTTGYVAAWDGTTVSQGILGICPGVANNLSSNAKGAPAQPFGSVGLGAGLTFGSVPNQSSAVNIPYGAPLVDGRQVVELAVPDSWFEAQIDNASTGTAVTAVTLVGGTYGLTIDATGHWYVDLNKTGGSAVLVIKELNPSDPLGTSFGRVWFTFLPAASQLYT
jgi:hypothetical protein